MKENLLDIIYELNVDLSEELCFENGYKNISEQIFIVLESGGFYERITFLGIELWRNDDDEREYDEETDTYEPMKPFLKRKMNECTKLIGSIMFNS